MKYPNILQATYSGDAGTRTAGDLILISKIDQLQSLNKITAHNLRGAAANIKMLAEILMEKNISEHNSAIEDPFTARQAIQYVHESSVSLLETLNELLNAAKTQPGAHAQYDVCDIGNISKHVLSQLNGFMRQKGATVALNLNVTQLNYPELYLESILYNFISNALKHSTPGTPLNISISTYTENDRVNLTVKDNGPGIDMAINGGSLFNAKEANHKDTEGGGIGLHMTRSLVESLGGKVSVKSRLGEGSEFTVVF